MSWKRRRSGGRKVAAREFAKEDIVNKVSHLMDNRRRLLAPFPLDPMDIYRLAWTAEEYAAIMTLMPYSDERMFRTSAMLTIKNLYVDNTKLKLVVTMPKEMPNKDKWNTEMFFSHLPNEQHEAISKWAPQWWALRREQDRLLDKVKDVADHINTFGQLYRTWPDLLSFFGEHGRSKVKHAHMKSKFPSAMLERNPLVEDSTKANAWLLKEKFRPEAFTEFTGMIAECLMLPMKEGKEIAILSEYT